MRFSVTLGAGGDGRDPAALARLAALAEAAGWDAFLLEDYLCYRGLPTYDPWVCLAAVAAATTRIRIGTTVTPAALPASLGTGRPGRGRRSRVHRGWQADEHAGAGRPAG